MERVTEKARAILASLVDRSSTVMRTLARRLDSAPAVAPPAAEAPPRVSAAEREATWALERTQALLERRTAELDLARAETDDLAHRVTGLESRIADLETQLDAARRIVIEHTAMANENLRLRGAVDALTDALTASHRTDQYQALEDEVEWLRSELTGKDLRIKDLAEERDRIADEADRLHHALEQAGRHEHEGSETLLRSELAQVKRSLEIERQRNLRLGRRRLFDPLR